MFRVGTTIKTMAVVWTFIFWGVFLWVLPMAILELEERVGLHQLETETSELTLRSNDFVLTRRHLG